jgi:hypothetical protein
MKKNTILCLLFLWSVADCFSQDLITTKKGEEIQAKVLEVGQTEIKYKKFDYQDGPVFIISKSDILQISYENGLKDVFTDKQKANSQSINVDEYGGSFSSGFALGGGGIGIGVPLRFYLNPKFALEADALIRPVIVSVDSKYNFYFGFNLAAGPVVYFSKYYNPGKNKVVLNGMSVKGGYCISKIKNSMIAINWAHETFKKDNKKRSFIFELGLGLVFWNQSDFEENFDTYMYSFPKTSPMIYWKCHWAQY